MAFISLAEMKEKMVNRFEHFFLKMKVVEFLIFVLNFHKRR